MVGHLLVDGAPAQIVETVTLVGLAQQGVEGLARSGARRRIGRYGEGGHVGKLLAWVRASVGVKLVLDS